MRLINGFSSIAVAAMLSLAAGAANAKTITTTENALRLLVPVSVLLKTPEGKAALAANLQVTGDIQNGTSAMPGLQPFAQRQAQALSDADITAENGVQLTDGLGTRLGDAYRSLVKCTKPANLSPIVPCTNISPNIAILIGYTAALTGADSNAAKYFFADEKIVTKTGGTPATPAEMAIIETAGGTADVFGQAYHKPAGSGGADKYGDSRPFQTEAKKTPYSGVDYFGAQVDNDDFLTGPLQDLTDSPAYPSGHTTYGDTESLLFAIMVPERFSQMVTRGAEYGNSRIIIGAHYAMDVIGGRSLAYYDVAQLLAEKPDYLGLHLKAPPVADYQAALRAARADLRSALEKACGGTIAACAEADRSRFSDAAANQAFYEATLTYGLPVVYPAQAGGTEDVAAKAPEAGYILMAAFPKLSLPEADHILTETEGPGGGFLDNGSAFGIYSRLDLYRAGVAAAAVK